VPSFFIDGKNSMKERESGIGDPNKSGHPIVNGAFHTTSFLRASSCSCILTITASRAATSMTS
jgi:hypothetical protein